MNRFNVGDKIVCINNTNSLNFSLTLYKTYTIIKVDNIFLRILDDDNDEAIYDIERFITLKEFRLLKIKQIYGQI